MRPRKKNRHLPPCVYLHHGAYWLVKSGRWERLGQDLSSALAEYGRRFGEPKGGLDDLIDSAMAVIKPKLALNTRNQYTIAARKLKYAFAGFEVSQLRAKHIASFKLGMADRPNMANRCLSVLKQVLDFAVEQQLIDSNPALGIKRHTEGKRKRLLSLEEFQRIRSHAPERLQSVMDLLYLTGQRVGDVLKLAQRDITDEGIFFTQQKTGAKLLVRWTPELRAAIKAIHEFYGNVRGLTLFHNRRGKVPDYKTVQRQWNRACELAEVQDAHIHDIRAMSLTAAKSQGKDATALAGHSSQQMTQRYLRDRQAVPVDGPSFSQLANISRRDG